MADIVQTQNPTSQNPTPTTANTDFDLNLNFDDLKIPEATEPKHDLTIDFSDIQPIKEATLTTPTATPVIPASTVSYTEALPPVEETKVIEEITPTPTAPAVETSETPVIIEEVKPAVVVEEVTQTEATSSEPLPATPITATESPSDDRLKQEDKIVEIKEEKTLTTETANSELLPATQVAATESPENFPTSSLAEDQKIIDELITSTKNSEPITETPVTKEEKPVSTIIKETTPPIETASSEPLPATQVVVPAPTSMSMDLDALLGTANTPVANEVISPVVAAPMVVQATTPVAAPIAQTETANPELLPASLETPAISTPTPGSTFQAQISPIITPALQTTNTPIPSAISQSPTISKSPKKLTTTILLLLLGGAAAYVLKTMYPLEYDSMQANVMSLFGGETVITENTEGLENMLSTTGDIISISTGSTNTGEVAATTGNLSTSGFNGFADLEDILTGAGGNPALTDQQLAELQKYSNESKTFLELGKKINDKTMIKYGLYISKKADGFIQSIANKEQIDNDKIAGYLAQFSGYLHQLTTLSYDTNAQAETTMIPETATVIQESQTNGSAQASSGISQSSTDLPLPNMIQDVNRENTGTTSPLP